MAPRRQPLSVPKKFHDISADQLQPGDIGLKSKTGETGGANSCKGFTVEN